MMDILFALPGKINNLANSKLDSVDGGTSISVNITDPLNPVINHLTTDGHLHVLATGLTNEGKVLTAGDSEGSLVWANGGSSLASYLLKS